MLPELNNAKILKKRQCKVLQKKKVKFKKKGLAYYANRTEGLSLFHSALPSLPQTLQTEVANSHVIKKKRKICKIASSQHCFSCRFSDIYIYKPQEAADCKIAIDVFYAYFSM